jgi:hypothetical protein
MDTMSIPEMFISCGTDFGGIILRSKKKSEKCFFVAVAGPQRLASIPTNCPVLICCKSLMVDAGEDNRPDEKDHYKPGLKDSTEFRD